MVRRPLIPNLRNGMAIGIWLLQLWISDGYHGTWCHALTWLSLGSSAVGRRAATLMRHTPDHVGW